MGYTTWHLTKCLHHNFRLTTSVSKSFIMSEEMAPKSLGLYDEMLTMHGQLDLYKQSGSVKDCERFITVYGSSSWSRNCRNYTASMSKTSFNMAGFI